MNVRWVKNKKITKPVVCVCSVSKFDPTDCGIFAQLDEFGKF